MVRGLYFVVNGGGDTDEEVTTCRAFFCEWDDRPLEEQEILWKTKDFLEPTFQVKTRKSIHCYWVLAEPMPSEDWRILQANLLNALDADRTLKNPSRVLRVAGSWHVKANADPVQCELINVSEKKYSQAEIEEALQKAQPPKPEQPKPDTSKPVTNGHILPIPLERCLPHKQRDLITNGARTGGRNVQGFGLAKDLLATEEWLQRNSIPYLDSAENLFLAYCSRCDSTDWTEREWQSIWQHALRDPRIEPPLPPEAIENCRKKWARENGVKYQVETSRPLSQPQAETSRVYGGHKDLKLPELVEFVQNEIADDLEFDELRSELLLEGKRLALGSDCKVWFYRRFKETAPTEDIYNTLINFAKEKSFNPVERYLEGVAEKPERVRIDNLAERYFGRSEPIYNRLVEMWLISAVARALNKGTPDNPGTQVDHTLILQSSQGKYKSTWFKVLGGAWFSDSVKDIESKDSLMIVHSNWIIELSELDRITSKKAAGILKHWLTQKTDSFRRPYAREIEPNLPRPCVFCGTVNPSRFLVDDENRRFWIIPVAEHLAEIDIPMVTRERDGIWAAAYDAYQSGAKWWPNDEEKAAIALINSDFREVDAWQDEIEAFIQGKECISSYQILTELFKIEPGQIKRAEDMRVMKILSNLGWTKDSKRLVPTEFGETKRRNVRLNPLYSKLDGQVGMVGTEYTAQGFYASQPSPDLLENGVKVGTLQNGHRPNVPTVPTTNPDLENSESLAQQGTSQRPDQSRHFSNSTPKNGNGKQNLLLYEDSKEAEKKRAEMVLFERDALEWSAERLRDYCRAEFGAASWEDLTPGQQLDLVYKLRAVYAELPNGGDTMASMN
ncbi:virulence-associated E family protein [Synechocystis sp. LKSZ1]|uniref:virulence-associated E family protein n=1 Tax=Synechocystis sp. LKSZ1 TaxID=3144951 RepID=UPI00336C06AA